VGKTRFGGSDSHPDRDPSAEALAEGKVEEERISPSLFVLRHSNRASLFFSLMSFGPLAR
jgi:hypothetical protein